MSTGDAAPNPDAGASFAPVTAVSALQLSVATQCVWFAVTGALATRYADRLPVMQYDPRSSPPAHRKP